MLGGESDDPPANGQRSDVAVAADSRRLGYVLNRLGLDQRGLEPCLSNPFPEINHHQIGRRHLRSLIADRCRGGPHPISLRCGHVVVDDLQGAKCIAFACDPSDQIIELCAQPVDLLHLLPDDVFVALKLLCG
jgi:hypothetical protein